LTTEPRVLELPPGSGGELIGTSPDAKRLAHYLKEFGERHPATLQSLPPDRLVWLQVIFAASRFLSDELLRHPDWISTLGPIDCDLSLADYQKRLRAFLDERQTRSPAALDLALFRRHELLRIVLRDILRIGSLAAITEELSNLADAILSRALESVTAEVEARHGAPALEKDGGSPAAFAVLALGKLGGRELNYSSDVDLMFLYSGNGETSGPQTITNGEFFKKVANRLTNLLSTYTAAGLCYRIDLRLRPEGTLGEICLSLGAAKDYYSRRARDWELQMLIKARVAAGAEAVGQALLDFVEPSIYSTTLDFSTIESMFVARERFNEKLVRKRLNPSELDVKLARGGIRDIEFLVQCLQRLHGAREIRLRHGSTLLALERLHERDLLSSTEYSRLRDAYEHFRRLEHLLQIEDDRQTHTLPSNPFEIERIAHLMQPRGFRPHAPDATARLLGELNQYFENVQTVYERIVHAQRPLHYAAGSSAAASAEDAPERIEVRGEVDLSGEILRALEQPAPRLVERLRARGVHRSEHSLTEFLQSLLDVPPYLELLDGNPAVADWTIQLFELSPHLAGQISRYPELLEEIRRAADHPTRRWVFEGLAAPLNDIEGLRRFFRREMFRILAGSICVPEPVFLTLDKTSALAEFVIARAYRIALERSLDHARRHAAPDKPLKETQAEMMVVALGRLGMREFDLGSDADLLFIIPDAEIERQRFWTRVAEHLIEILTTYVGDGPILSLDTRLRPNGREGMLVQTESAYVDYFASKAEAWEGIAYMKARAVAGDTDRATTFLNELQQVDWRRYGQSGRSKYDLRQMRARLQREQGSLTPLKAAEGGYYDADFILMYLRLKGAGMFFKSLNTPERIDIVEKMGHLDRADAESLLRATTHFRALDHALRVVTGRAEEKIPAAEAEREMVAILVERWTGRHIDPANLASDLLALQVRTRKIFDRIFA
jgi:[glutamine synthetase] adenylyltransferase / [glutamine synthetase]-adenylyl-L-tyrosine phosphorylase